MTQRRFLKSPARLLASEEALAMTRAATRRMSTFSMELHILGSRCSSGFGFERELLNGSRVSPCNIAKPAAFMPEHLCGWGSET